MVYCIIFLYLCPVVLPKSRAADFYWKESEFSLIRLGESGQFANVSADIGNQACL